MTSMNTRLAFVVSEYLGDKAGSYVASWSLVNALARAGIRVTVFAQHVDFGCDMRRCGARIVRPLLRHGCRWHLPIRVLAHQVAWASRSQNVDLVVVCGITRLARYILQGPTASKVMAWEFTNATPGNKFVDRKATTLLSRVRSILSPSEMIDSKIRGTYGYTGPVVRLPFWIEDYEYSEVPFRHSLDYDFIYMGRRDRDKGLFELVEATAALAKERSDLRVLITGSGDKAPFSDLARRLGVDRNITFRFFPSRTEAITALQHSRFLVLPSYHEGYPLVLLEAAQEGVPFIATDVGSVRELFGNNPAATIIPPHDAEVLARAMRQALMMSTADYTRMREAAFSAFKMLSSRNAVDSFVRRAFDMEQP